MTTTFSYEGETDSLSPFISLGVPVPPERTIIKMRVQVWSNKRLEFPIQCPSTTHNHIYIVNYIGGT
ncbi:MAG: hypothetical protein ACXQS2_03730, partial [Methermicoccaceae archaeon]